MTAVSPSRATQSQNSSPASRPTAAAAPVIVAPPQKGPPPVVAPTKYTPVSSSSDGARTADSQLDLKAQIRARKEEAAALGRLPARAREVLGQLPPDAQKYFKELAVKSLPGGADSALLDKDSKGVTLLDRVAQLVKVPISPELEAQGISKPQLLDSILQEAARPGQINQSDHGTCTVTSMQYMLCSQNPAEYARLMQGLISPEGSAPLRNGDTLKRLPDSIPQDSATDRSASERLFQAAMMDYSNGNYRYSNVTDLSSREGRNDGSVGLGDQQIRRGAEGLFGGSFHSFRGSNGDEAGEKIMEKLEKILPGQVLGGINWADGGGHEIVIEKIQDGRVFYRNPWGSSDDPNGAKEMRPLRRMEDREIGLESMAFSDFKRRIESVILPESVYQ